jgi:flavin reductase (DIM6/NTAB) family NADH-FMN oxidoreductase RutF
MHVTSEPGILYFGTPVVPISTTDEDRSYNLAPMSSAFWLGWRCLLGLGRNIQDYAEHHANRRVRPQSAVRRQ